MKGPNQFPDQLANAHRLYRDGKAKHALGACRKVLKTDPRNFDALCLAAMAQARLGRLTNAAKFIARALVVRPNNPSALNAQGDVMMSLGHYDKAVQSFGAALAAEPHFADAHFNLGNALVAQGREEEAVSSFSAAIAVRPDWLDAIIARATLLAVLGRHQEALAGLDDAIAREPRFAMAHYNRGLTLKKIARPEDALDAFRAAIEIDPGFVEAHNNFANTLKELHRYEDAVVAFREVIRRNPDYAMGFYNLGTVLAELCRYDEAIACLEETMRLDPDFATAGHFMSFVMLAIGRYREGWKNYEYRLRYVEGSPHPAERYAGGRNVQRITGDAARDLAGRSVLLYKEQGLGDEIMFASSVPDAVRAAAALTLECEVRLKGLFARSFPDVQLITSGDAEPAGVEKRYMSGSLGRLFRNQAEDFPGTPYLVADAVRRVKMRARLDALGNGRKIGIMWRGGVGSDTEGARSMHLADMVPKMGDDVHWISLSHLDRAAEEVTAFNTSHDITVHHWPEVLQSQDYDDTAALLAALDAVVTVTCTIGHCCGALGTPVHVLVPRTPEWRYGLYGTTIPWYDSMTLYRQEASGEWPFAVVRAARRDG